MEMSWRTGKDRLECRWSDRQLGVPYNPPWMQDASKTPQISGFPASLPDPSKLSPFGGRHWYALTRPR
jgi:hypothetical protein